MPNEMELLEQEQSRDLAPSNPFAVAARPLSANAAADTDQTRAIAETQAAMVIAKRFPRDQIAAMDRILQAFTRPTLAESAMYSYSRGGTDITGPSIRAAETLAQCWGNIQFGVRELEQRNGESTVEAFAWDIETNARQVKVFQVPHLRYTKKGSYKLEDPRDVYELVANQGARRLRACILGIIPGDVTEQAMRQCETTLRTKIEVTPDLIKSLLAKFAEHGVMQAQIEKRIQRHMDAITPALVVQLGKIYNSLKDGMSTPSEWFETDVDGGEQKQAAPARGSAGLKAAASKAASAPAAAAAPATPVTEDGEFVPSFAYVAEKLNKAKTEEARVEAHDLIRHVADARHRVDLEALSLERRDAITTGGK